MKQAKLFFGQQKIKAINILSMLNGIDLIKKIKMKKS